MPDISHKYGLPYRAFLYTFDQVASMLELDLQNFKQNYVFYEGVTTSKKGNFLLARNLEVEPGKTEWRISEGDLIRFMRVRGFRLYVHGKGY